MPGAILPQPSTTLPSDLAPRDEAAWKIIQEYIDRVDRGELTLTATEQFWTLGQEILKRVAEFYHPQDKDPMLEYKFHSSVGRLKRPHVTLRL